MSRIIVGLSAAAFIFASSQFVFADENGLVTGAVGGAVAGAVVGGPVGAVVGGVGGAAIGNSVTNHRHYHRGYAYHPYHHHYVNTDQIDDVRREGVVEVQGLSGRSSTEYCAPGCWPGSRSLARFVDPVDDAELWRLANACAEPRPSVARSVSRGLPPDSNPARNVPNRPHPRGPKPRARHSRDHGSSRSGPC